MADQQPPQNVRVELPDGEIVPCELVYIGVEEDLHVWQAVTEVAVPLGREVRILIDALPASTSIRLTFADRVTSGG